MKFNYYNNRKLDQNNSNLFSFISALNTTDNLLDFSIGVGIEH